jgi:uncharacterized protein (DUF305 family)
MAKHERGWRPAARSATWVALLVTASAVAGCGGADPAGTPDDRATSTTPVTSNAGTSRTAPTPRSTAPPPTVVSALPSPTGRPARGKHVRADAKFAAQLAVHRAQSVELAVLLLAKPYINEQVRALATRVRSEQAAQVELLRGWLAGWNTPVPAPNGSPTAAAGPAGDPSRIPGMQRADDVDALRRMSGNDAARLYLAMMVNHELGAVQLANIELAGGRNPTARALAARTATREAPLLTQMNELLDGRIHPPGKV